MTRPSWSLGDWAVLVAAVTAAAGVFVGLLVWSRLAFVLVVVLCVTHGLSWWLPNRGLRAELAAARKLHAAWDGGAVRDDLAEVGPVTPPRGTVELYDQDQMAEWRERSASDPLALAASVGREHAAQRPPALSGTRDVDAQDRELADIYGIGSRADDADYEPAGFSMHVSRGFDKDPFAPGCGCRVAACGLVEPRKGCGQHDNCKTIRKAHTADECPGPELMCADHGPCAYLAHGMAECDDGCAVALSDDEEARQFLADARDEGSAR